MPASFRAHFPRSTCRDLPSQLRGSATREKEEGTKSDMAGSQTARLSTIWCCRMTAQAVQNGRSTKSTGVPERERRSAADTCGRANRTGIQPPEKGKLDLKIALSEF